MEQLFATLYALDIHYFNKRLCKSLFRTLLSQQIFSVCAAYELDYSLKTVLDFISMLTKVKKKFLNNIVVSIVSGVHFNVKALVKSGLYSLVLHHSQCYRMAYDLFHLVS